MRPKLLDGFCKAGGAGMGYYRAGFEVVGVDIEPQKNFPFEFIQADWFEFIAEHWQEYDAYHVSPPCQAYGKTKYLAGDHPKLIERVRAVLIETRKPYVIENVPGAPLINPVMLSGAMFGMNILRDRLFECNFMVPFMLSPVPMPPVKMGRPVREGDVLQPVGHFSGADYARRQMGIDWMTQGELSQAIPPVFTKYIGEHMLNCLQFDPRSGAEKVSE